MYHLALVLGLVLPGGVDELEVVAVVRVVAKHEVAVEAGEVAVKPWTQYSTVQYSTVQYSTVKPWTHHPVIVMALGVRDVGHF